MSVPLTFVTWLWKSPPGYRSTFTADHVNRLRHMLKRHYPAPHRFVCVTDLPKGMDPDVEVIPAWNDFASLPPPSGLAKNPSCYRRLRMFHPEIGAHFGPRFASFDLDVVIVNDMRPILDRPEDFVMYGDTNPRTFYNGSLVLMNAGARSKVWTTFDPKISPALAKAAGHFGSDQGWISYCLGPNEAKWTQADGVYSFQKHVLPAGPRHIPPDARIVIFHGHVDPDSPAAQRYDWVRLNYA